LLSVIPSDRNISFWPSVIKARCARNQAPIRHARPCPRP
jgi:hypothetical protein